MTKTNRIESWIWKLFLLLFGVDMISVFVISIMKPQNNLPTLKVFILTFMLICFWGVIYQFRQKLEPILIKVSFIAQPVFMLVYGLILYLMAISEWCEPVHDQNAVYEGALYFAGLSEDISWEYFARCNNNIMPTIILGFIFRVGSLGGVVNPSYFATLVNVAQVLLAMHCLFQLGMKRNSIFSAWMGNMIFAMYFLPIACHSMSFYTDAMSFSFGIAGFYLWEKSKEQDNKAKSWMHVVLLGILFGVAAIIKLTAIIPLIAIIGYTVIKKNWKLMGRTICSLLIVIGIFLVCNHLTTLLPCEEMRDGYGTPKLSYWVGIGLQGNGGYIDNQEYSQHLNTIYGMDKKEEWSNQYIKENIGNFFNVEHIISKLRYNFANGDMGGYVFLQTGDASNLFYRLMHYNGAHFWRYTMIITSIMFFIYICIIMEIFTLLLKQRETDSVSVVALLSVFGIMLYVMLFEANHRQLYNHLPWFILVAESGLADFWNRSHAKEENKNKDLLAS